MSSYSFGQAFSLAGNVGQQGSQGSAGATGPQGNFTRVGTGSPTSSNPSTQNDGDTYIQLDATGGPMLWGPRASGAWPASGTSLAGVAGNTIGSGTTIPGGGYGNNGDLFIVLPATLYKKANGAWSVVSQLANTISYGTAVPGQQYGTSAGQGDVYLQNSGGTTYLWSKASGVWSQVAQLTGSVGPAGSRGAAVLQTSGAPTSSSPSGQADGDFALDITTAGGPYLYGPRASGSWSSTPVVLGGSAFRNGVGSPTSSIGSVNDFYLDTTSGAPVLWGPKTSSGWPSAGTPLVGPQGSVGNTGAAGVSPPGLYSGSGAPSSSNPSGTQIVGSYYLRTDTTPQQLYGPLSSSGWPSTGTATAGGYFQTSNGPPQSSLGNVGDVCIDLTNALFYPPKTTSGWTATPINMVGPTGATGATTSYRQSVRGSYWTGTSTAPTAGTAYSVVSLVSQAASNAVSGVALSEPMYAAGSLTALTAASASNVGAGVWTINVLKNGSSVYTASSFIATGTTAATAYKVLPTGLTFAAGDVFTMTASTTTTNTNQSFSVNLIYTTNS